MENNLFREKTIHIYHHGDTDGITAGACIYHMINIKGYAKRITYRINNYDQEFDFSLVEKQDLVFFVDYSFTNTKNIKALENLIKRLYSGNVEEAKHYIYWFDHHGSSFKYSNQNPLNLVTQIIDTRICGAAICYAVGKYCEDTVPVYQFNINVKLVKGVLSENPNEYMDNEYIKYVDSWDTWKHNMRNDEEFNLGAMKNFNDPKDQQFLQILTDGSRTKYSMYCIHDGFIIKDYLEELNKIQLNEMSYEFTLDGYKCIMYNGRGNSCTFGNLIDKYDICAMFYFTGETYLYSLYSKNVNTAEISERMGGGGHPGASGFQNKTLLFKKGTVYSTK